MCNPIKNKIMKNLKSLSLAVLGILFISLVIASCKTASINIVKRHYRHGYYVNLDATKSNKNNINTSEKSEKAKSDTRVVSQTAAITNNRISNNEDDSNLTASIDNEILLIKNEPKFYTPNTVKKSNVNQSRPFPIIKEKIKKMFSFKSINSEKGDHNTLSKILKIGGTIIAIIGISIFLSAYPMNEAGMILGRLLLSIGLLSGLIGMLC